MKNISIMDDSAIMYDDVKSHTTKKRILIKRKQPIKRKISTLYLHFY